MRSKKTLLRIFWLVFFIFLFLNLIAAFHAYRFTHFDAEATDRKDMKLPYGQDELLQKLVDTNPRTVVVLLGGGPMEMGSWLSKAPAVLQAWYPGMEGGNALAAVLFGDVNPSGKLACTFPKRLEDSPAHAMGNYPGKDGVVRYEEGFLQAV